jgi:hypothetical protein
VQEAERAHNHVMTVQRVFRGVKTRTVLRRSGVPTLTTADQQQLSVSREASPPPQPTLSPEAQNLFDARTVASRELRGDVRLLRLEGSRSVYCGRVAPIKRGIVSSRAEMGRPLSSASSREGREGQGGEEGREEEAERDQVAWVAPNGLGITDYPSNDSEVRPPSLFLSFFLSISLSPLSLYLSSLCSSFSPHK